LARAADRTIRGVRKQWEILRRNGTKAYDESVGDALMWMQSDEYLVLAARSLESRVREPLLARGIPVSA
jgi:hypothetical protein